MSRKSSGIAHLRNGQHVVCQLTMHANMHGIKVGQEALQHISSLQQLAVATPEDQ
jgi:hypothetical protein